MKKEYLLIGGFKCGTTYETDCSRIIFMEAQRIGYWVYHRQVEYTKCPNKTQTFFLTKLGEWFA